MTSNEAIKPLYPSTIGRDVNGLLRLMEIAAQIPFTLPDAPPSSGHDPRMLGTLFPKQIALSPAPADDQGSETEG